VSSGAGCRTETDLDSSGGLEYDATGERPLPEPDATDKEQQAPLGEGPWHDKILGDAIGYTKGLVTVLDSLSEGFRRRGQELEELRHRLAILQSERRTLQEERAGLEAQIGTRTAECEALRQELAQGRTALEVSAQEIQALNVACEDANRQAEELREIVRSLERKPGQNRPSTVHHLPGPRVREGAAPVELPGAPRRDEAEPSQPRSAIAGPADLQVQSLITERDRLRAELEKRDQELDRLHQELAQDQASVEARVRELQEQQRASAEAIREKQQLQEVVRGLEQVALRQELAAESRLTAPEPRQDEKHPQPAPIATSKAFSPTASPPQAAKTSKYRHPYAGMTVECMLEASGEEITRIYRGEVSRLNGMGLMGVFDERLPEGQRVVVRFARGEEEYSCHGRLVRVRPSARAPAGPPIFDHLIRFDTPIPGFSD
jgi:peptidoglycan hydrolase CwlO-like protein